MERGEEEPEAYAVKNWIVRAQSFLIACATEGFTENYEMIMYGKLSQGSFCGDKSGRAHGDARTYSGDLCVYDR